SLLMIQSDYDLLPQYRRGSRAVNLYAEPGHVCHYGLAHADLIVAQTVEQQMLLRERFERESTLVAQPIDLDQPAPEAPAELPERFVLWIGKADDYKRPYLCLELARLCAETPFVMIVNRGQPEIYQSVVDRLPPNVRLIEFVPFHLIEGYIRRATLLVNTSAYEGFPHVFLQAGKYGVPVVALSVDPDGLLSRHAGGVVAHDNLPAMAEAVGRLLSDDSERRRLGTNLQSYARSRHDAAEMAGELARAIEQLMRGPAEAER
ncbi:MAG TPA: glycosyltransferase family 4 protein, partial [Pirellulales bacterium]|nr:glycosyltransferase family 4 protein [Pirellulales bacterium]